MAAAAAAVSAASVAGRVFFVTGASGTVGSGVACALLDAGAKVATSSRGGAVPDKLSRFGDSLLVLKGTRLCSPLAAARALIARLPHLRACR
jgi:NAD(P)-dependent dehydrogenase (short-subunit alcohol dehydrogenase family)